MIGIGVDTGGTFTDAVVFDDETREVLASCKTLTTPDDLCVCIGQAIDSLPPDLVAQAKRISLSTTLATNACIEGKGGRARLVIAGTSEGVLHDLDAPTRFGMQYSDVLPIAFKGSYDGLDVKIPDWEQLCNDNEEFFSQADSFGIAGLYALNNGAAVEHSCADYLGERYGKPVVKATDVAASPNVLERGATALLNARLIPIIESFVDAMKRALEQRGLDIPIGIVRSNGTLMSSEAAKVSPVETIISGPAASAVGALSLSDARESLVIDIGGTTSDIAVIHDARPVSSDGIRIGGWRTQVKGARIDTIGLGGDTRVVIGRNGGLSLATRRALPFCVAAKRWSCVKDMLNEYLKRDMAYNNMYYEILFIANEPADASRYAPNEQELLELLADGPVSVLDKRFTDMRINLERLEKENVIMRCSFTPTDAMHVKGDFDRFDTEAARLGALCLMKSMYHYIDEMGEPEIQEIADTVYDLVCRRLYGQVVRVLLQDRYPSMRDVSLDEQLETLIDDAWARHRDGVPASPFDVDFETSMTLIGVGAPTHVFLPNVASALHAPCVIPDHAEVANAIGALSVRVVVEEVARVVSHRGAGGAVDGYTLQSRGISQLFKTREEALEVAAKHVEAVALEEAARRGAQGELVCDVTTECHIPCELSADNGEWVVTATAQVKQG